MKVSTESLANYALEVSINDIPPEIIERTKRLVIDSLGVAIESYQTEAISSLRDEYLDFRRQGREATLLGTRDMTETSFAALINGSMVRYLDKNDAYSSGDSACHPSDHIGSLLSVAEAENASGSELIEAIVVAYEIQCGGTDTNLVWKHGFDMTVWGGYAQAAAAGKLMGLTNDELRHAIGITASSTNGLLGSRMGKISMWKGIAGPYAQQNAIQACTMARGGITGPTDIFEVSGGGVFDTITKGPARMVVAREKEDDYKINHTIVKSYACGGGAHVPVHGILTFMKDHDIDASQIESIEIQAIPYLEDIYYTPERWNPQQSRESADHSIPYCVAAAAVYGRLKTEQFKKKCLRDPRVHKIMEKINVEPVSNELKQRYERKSSPLPQPMNITVDGSEYNIKPDSHPGHPANPFSKVEFEEKFIDSTGSLLTDEQQKEALRCCNQLENLDSVYPIIESVVV